MSKFIHPIQKHLDRTQSEGLDAIIQSYGLPQSATHKATAQTIHIWGQFSRELPDFFKPDEGQGHKYITCKTLEEAEKTCQQLRTFIFTKWPDAVEWTGEGWYRWMIYDLRQLTLNFE
jgi:hypothetical protein